MLETRHHVRNTVPESPDRGAVSRDVVQCKKYLTSPNQALVAFRESPKSGPAWPGLGSDTPPLLSGNRSCARRFFPYTVLIHSHSFVTLSL
jgi:hypothetical protein